MEELGKDIWGCLAEYLSVWDLRRLMRTNKQISKIILDELRKVNMSNNVWFIIDKYQLKCSDYRSPITSNLFRPVIIELCHPLFNDTLSFKIYQKGYGDVASYMIRVIGPYAQLQLIWDSKHRTYQCQWTQEFKGIGNAVIKAIAMWKDEFGKI